MSQLISVIVPAYNAAQTIVKTLESVRDQTWTQWECIIVDDGSKDDTYKIVKTFTEGDERFLLLRIDNAGVCVARNTGVSAAKGFYVFPLDADNYLHPDCLNQLINAFQEHPDLKLAYCEPKFFGEKTGSWNLPPYDFPLLLRMNLIDNSSLFLKSDFERVGGYRTNMTHGLEDWDFFIALLAPYRKCQVFKLKERLYYYRVTNYSRGQSLVQTPEYQKMLDNLVYNNFEIYQRYYPAILKRVLHFDYQERIINKWPIRMMIKCMHLFTHLKSLFK